MLTAAASQIHPCRSWRICPSDHCFCLDPQVDSAPWGEMLFLKGFIFSVPYLCWGGFWSLLEQRKKWAPGQWQKKWSQEMVHNWSLFSHVKWRVWQTWDWWKLNSPQALWVCCSRNRSSYRGIDDSVLLIDQPQHPLPDLRWLAF